MKVYLIVGLISCILIILNCWKDTTKEERGYLLLGAAGAIIAWPLYLIWGLVVVIKAFRERTPKESEPKE